MITHADTTCSILFGDATIANVHYKAQEFTNCMLKLRTELGLKNLIFQHQTHGTAGRYIDALSTADTVEISEFDGDFLVTNQPLVGIGVRTADCLPIVFYAPKHHVVAIAHAGWRGSVAGIAGKTLECMRQYHKILPQDIKLFFGPAAKSCCYTVQSDFLPNLETFDYKDRLIIKRNGLLFFDNILLNKLQLIDLGIAPDQINMANNSCTICNKKFHSYRRAEDKTLYLVQPTVVWLTA